MIFLWIIIALLLWSFIEQKLLMNTEIVLKADKKGLPSENITFVLLADLHNKRFGKDNKRLTEKIIKVNPDFIIVAGDLITKQELCIPGNAYSLIKNLAGKIPIYYAYGNHEQYLEQLKEEGPDTGNEKRKALFHSWLAYKEELTKLGIQFLDNNSITVKNKKLQLRITGISIDREHFSKTAFVPMREEYLKELAGSSDKNCYQLLIAHNPVYFKDYVNWGADLILSGHLHGGLIRLPYFGGIVSPQYKFFPKYDAGTYEDHGKYMIVSRGLGSHSVMLRLFNRPELVTVKVKINEN